MSKRDTTLARVAVQLAREDAGRFMTTSEVVAAAERLVDAAHRARAAVERGSNPEAHFAEVRKVADKFEAELIPRRNPRGMVVGIRFRTGRFKESPQDIFYVT